MSTHWGYTCLSHDPPLSSDTWFNHGEQILLHAYQTERAGQWPRDPAITAWDEPVPVYNGGHGTTAPIEWLRQHPRCNVALRNEYGDVQPIPEAGGDLIELNDRRSTGPTRERGDSA